jgi:hypothetical protein
VTAETNALETNLSNCFNEFLVLSSSQFIESRVYQDASESADSQEEPLMSQEQLEDPVQVFKQALLLGIKAFSETPVLQNRVCLSHFLS